jgi:hypothetical protein
MKWTFIPLILLVMACSRKDYIGEWQRSSTGRYQLRAVVDRTDDGNTHHFGLVVITVADSTGKTQAVIDTRAADVMKWSVNWSDVGDTIILQSSDIGTKKWVMIGYQAQPVASP